MTNWRRGTKLHHKVIGGLFRADEWIDRKLNAIEERVTSRHPLAVNVTFFGAVVGGLAWMWGVIL